MKQKIKKIFDELERIESPRISANEICKRRVHQEKATTIKSEELNFYIPEKWGY